MPAEAQAVRQLFDEVAPHYDRLNDLLSLVGFLGYCNARRFDSDHFKELLEVVLLGL